MTEENENMNPESIKSIKEFREKQIQTNIKIHIFVLTMVIFINICLIAFIISYKYKIKQISSSTKRSSSRISKGTYYLSSLENTLLHKVVNVFAMSANAYGNIHFSFLFEHSEEVQSIKNSINSYSKFEKPYLHLIYESNIDEDNSSVILNLIKYWANILIIIGSKSGEKFGFFFQESVYPSKRGFFQSKGHKCFLYSFKNQREYPCNGNEISFVFNYNSLLNIGNGDIIIHHQFKTKGGIINFPFKSFYIPERELEFEKLNGMFEIKDIEIYLVFDINEY